MGVAGSMYSRVFLDISPELTGAIHFSGIFLLLASKSKFPGKEENRRKIPNF